jgi:hypothetical protein
VGEAEAGDRHDGDQPWQKLKEERRPFSNQGEYGSAKAETSKSSKSKLRECWRGASFSVALGYGVCGGSREIRKFCWHFVYTVKVYRGFQKQWGTWKVLEQGSGRCTLTHEDVAGSWCWPDSIWNRQDEQSAQKVLVFSTSV